MIHIWNLHDIVKDYKDENYLKLLHGASKYEDKIYNTLQKQNEFLITSPKEKNAPMYALKVWKDTIGNLNALIFLLE